jgi:hypothetical protein
MATCWASCLGDCADKASREHLVTESLWEGDSIAVVGFSWCKDKPKPVGPNAVGAKILCRYHNSLLSPVDSEGKRAFNVFRRITELGNRRSQQRLRRWKLRRFEIDGPLLERWFVKTAINLCSALDPELVWADSGSPVGSPPRSLVVAAFGHTPLDKPMGLYGTASMGEQLQFADAVEFAPILTNERQVVAGLFNFRGPRFLVNLRGEPLPAELQLPEGRGRAWPTSALYYHLKRMNFKVGRWQSHYVDFLWMRRGENGPSGAWPGPV